MYRLTENKTSIREDDIDYFDNGVQKTIKGKEYPISGEIPSDWPLDLIEGVHFKLIANWDENYTKNFLPFLYHHHKIIMICQIQKHG